MSTAVNEKACPANVIASSKGWPLERALFAMAGSMVLIASVLTLLISPWFVLLAAFAGVNQWLYVAVGACPASMVLTRLFGFTKGASR